MTAYLQMLNIYKSPILDTHTDRHSSIAQAVSRTLLIACNKGPNLGITWIFF